MLALVLGQEGRDVEPLIRHTDSERFLLFREATDAPGYENANGVSHPKNSLFSFQWSMGRSVAIESASPPKRGQQFRLPLRRQP